MPLPQGCTTGTDAGLISNIVTKALDFLNAPMRCVTGVAHMRAGQRKHVNHLLKGWGPWDMDLLDIPMLFVSMGLLEFVNSFGHNGSRQLRTARIGREPLGPNNIGKSIKSMLVGTLGNKPQELTKLS